MRYKSFAFFFGNSKSMAFYVTTMSLMAAFLAVRTVAGETVIHGQAAQIAASQWDVLDIRFRIDELPDNAIDVECSANFKSEHGDTLSVSAFYNGDNEFLVRFTPPSPGIWTYSTSSSEASLNNLAGKVTVRPADRQRKGGILVSPVNKLSFSYSNGDRYYPIAFESDWLFALDAENAEGIPKTKKLVDTLAENGFNQVVMNVYAYDVNWQKDEALKPQFEYGSPDVFPFLGNNDDARLQRSEH